MVDYEIRILTPNGAIIGSFDTHYEANALFQWAKREKYDILCRKIDYELKDVKEIKIVENKDAFKCDDSPSIDALKNILATWEMELSTNAYHDYEKLIRGCLNVWQVEDIRLLFSEDCRLNQNEMNQLETMCKAQEEILQNDPEDYNTTI